MFGNSVSLFKVFGFEVKIDISLLRELPVRAKIVDIWAGEDLLKKAASRRISRQSGLTDAPQNHLKEILTNSKPIQ